LFGFDLVSGIAAACQVSPSRLALVLTLDGLTTRLCLLLEPIVLRRIHKQDWSLRFLWICLTSNTGVSRSAWREVSAKIPRAASGKDGIEMLHIL
jgi:hypothetical protein